MKQSDQPFLPYSVCTTSTVSNNFSKEKEKCHTRELQQAALVLPVHRTASRYHSWWCNLRGEPSDIISGDKTTKDVRLTSHRDPIRHHGPKLHIARLLVVQVCRLVQRDSLPGPEQGFKIPVLHFCRFTECR